MAINSEIWTKDFAANLYETADWYTFGRNYSQYVTAGIVHIPQAVATSAPVAVTGGTSLPLTVEAASYDDLTFTMKMIASAPKYVTNINASEASFDTRSELMKDMVGFMKQAISIEIADKWATVATSSVLATTGSTRTNIYGKTGVKALTFADILAARARLISNTKNVNLNALYLIVDPILYNDLVNLTQFQNADKTSLDVNLAGFVGQIAGFKVIQRSVGLPFVNSTTKASILYTDAHANTTFSGALAVSADSVAYALGTVENGQIKMGVEPYATGYFSDVLQGHTRVGASPLYKAVSNVVKGVVSIIEA